MLSRGFEWKTYVFLVDGWPVRLTNMENIFLTPLVMWMIKNCEREVYSYVNKLLKRTRIKSKKNTKMKETC